MILKILIYGGRLTKIEFIAEIASTHNGSVKELNKLVNKIITGSSDYIKFQIFNNNQLCHKSSSLYKSLKKIEIEKKHWQKIISKVRKKKKIILEPFDQDSYEFCKKFKKFVLIKISSTEHDNDLLIKDALKNFNKVFFNISGFEINYLMKYFKSLKNPKKKLVLMYGYQSFPSEPKYLRLNILSEIKKKGYVSGYADHSDTSNEALTYFATKKSIELGAKYIEKHITLNRDKKKPDYISSFSVNDFENYVNFFKKENLEWIQDKNLTTSNKEKLYCNLMNKFAVTKKNIDKDEKIDLKKIKFLRTGKKGINRHSIEKFLKKNKKYQLSLSKNIVIQSKHFK